ncbi:MAG TPA: HNH endonuclease signature motif containing protein, partial [Candidatus Dormibacteraeota bacterium]
RRALHARDRTCRYPGCPISARRTRGHHIIPWWEGGPTDLANGVSLCEFHHGRLHEGEFTIRRGVGDELIFETPDGVEIAPPRREPLDASTGGAAYLQRCHTEGGLAIVAATPSAGWGGERCDPNYVADVYSEAAFNARARAGPAERSPTSGGRP